MVVDDDWTLSQTMFGVTTYYRREPDNSLSIKLEGELNNVPIFEQICVLKEVDLHCQWAPFCSSSMTIEELDKLDMVGWFVLGLPHLGLARDACFRAIGCDSMAEDGSFLLVGQGVRDRKPGDPPPDDSYLSEDPILDEIDFPDPPTSMGSGRMTIRHFEAIVHILSPTRVRTRLIANVNPNLKFIPQSLLDFLMKKLCGVMLLKLQGAAKKILKNPIRNPHARRMRENPDFYKNWLIAKIDHYCREKGWDMPKVSAFEALEGPLGRGSLINGMSSAALLQLHSTSELDEELPNSHAGHDYNRTHSAPVLDFSTSRDDSDAMSGISTTMSTDTVKSNNPIAAYLREAEERARKKKEGKVNEARNRAAARLKPKEFSDDQSVRLEELKLAKARRGGGAPLQEVQLSTARSVGSAPTIALTHSTVPAEKVAVQSHSQTFRLVGIVALVVALFAVLYSHAFVDASMSSSPLGQSLVTIAYVAASAFIHFYLSEVVMVYAFDSMELGGKTGFEARKYYNENVRMVVAAVSIGIVVLSISKALMDVGMRTAVWGLVRLSRWIQPQLRAISIDVANQTFNMIPSVVKTTGSTVVGPSLQVLVGSIRLILRVVFDALYEIVIASNAIGRGAELFAESATTATTTFLRSGGTFVTDIVRSCEGNLELPSWKTITVDTSRALFSYTSVFMLATVTLFKFMVAQSKMRPAATGQSESVADEQSSTAPSSPVQRDIPRKLKATQTRYSTIHEEGEDEIEVTVQSPKGDSGRAREVAPTNSPVPASQGYNAQSDRTASTEPKRRRLFPRFRRKNRLQHAETAPRTDDDNTRERRRFRKSSTA